MTATSKYAHLDKIFLRNLALNVPIGPDAWHRKDKVQPVILSVRIAYRVTNAAKSDDVSKTLDYGKLCKAITALAAGEGTVAENGSFVGFSEPRVFSNAVGSLILDMMEAEEGQIGEGVIEVDVRLPKGVLRASGGLRLREMVETVYRPGMKNQQSFKDHSSILNIEGVQCACLLGVNPHERLEKQQVVLDWTVEDRDSVERGLRVYQRATKEVIERVEGSVYRTVEALATFVARILTMEFGLEACTVSIQKPSAIANAEGAGVEITRSRTFFSKPGFWKEDNSNDADMSE